MLKHILLGTERLPFQRDDIPAPLRSLYFSGDEMIVPEEDLLLQAATLKNIFDNGAFVTPTFEGITLATAPTEVLPYCSPYASQVFQVIKPKLTKNPFLLYRFLDKLLFLQWVVTPEIVVDLLQWGTTKKGEHLRYAIQQVVGKRGQWLVQFNSKWQYVQRTFDAATHFSAPAEYDFDALQRADWIASLPTQHAWSLPYSEAVLSSVYKSYQYGYFAKEAALQPYFAYLHPNVMLEQIAATNDSMQQKFAWSEYCTKDLAAIVALIKQIDKIDN